MTLSQDRLFSPSRSDTGLFSRPDLSFLQARCEPTSAFLYLLGTYSESVLVPIFSIFQEYILNIVLIWIWWCLIINIALGRWMQMDQEFQASLSYIGSLKTAWATKALI